MDAAPLPEGPLLHYLTLTLKRGYEWKNAVNKAMVARGPVPGGDPAGLTDPARVLEVGPHARMATSGATVGCLLDIPLLWPHTATTTIVPHPPP